MPHFMIVLMPYINLLNLFWGDKMSIFEEDGAFVEMRRNCPLSTIFCYLLLDFHVKTWTRFSLQDQRLFEKTKSR